MYSQPKRLHFKTEQAYSGFAAVTGILRAEKDKLVIEYQVKDNLVGVLKSKPKYLAIPYTVLEEVEYKVNWFTSKFRLRVNSMQILGEFPVGKDGEIVLNIKRKQKQTAKEMASYVNLRLSEVRLDLMGEDHTPFTE